MDNQIIFTIGVIVALASGYFIRLFTQDQKNNTEKAEIKKGKKKNEIEQTPASDLVAAAPNADELCNTIQGIKDRAGGKLLDRIRKIISRVDDN